MVRPDRGERARVCALCPASQSCDGRRRSSQHRRQGLPAEEVPPVIVADQLQRLPQQPAEAAAVQQLRAQGPAALAALVPERRHQLEQRDGGVALVAADAVPQGQVWLHQGVQQRLEGVGLLQHLGRLAPPAAQHPLYQRRQRQQRSNGLAVCISGQQRCLAQACRVLASGAQPARSRAGRRQLLRQLSAGVLRRRSGVYAWALRRPLAA
jgi:hypothetical protein